MRNLDLDWEDSYDYGPNEMVELQRNNPREYDKIMSQNIGTKSQIEDWYEDNRKWAQDCLYQQRNKR